MEEEAAQIIIETDFYATKVFLFGKTILNKDLEFGKKKKFRFRFPNPELCDFEPADEKTAVQVLRAFYTTLSLRHRHSTISVQVNRQEQKLLEHLGSMERAKDLLKQGLKNCDVRRFCGLKP